MKDKIDKIYTMLLITVITALILITLALFFAFHNSPFINSAELYYNLLGLLGGIVPFVLCLDGLYIFSIFNEELKEKHLSSFIHIGAIVGLIGGALVAVGIGVIWPIGIV